MPNRAFLAPHAGFADGEAAGLDGAFGGGDTGGTGDGVATTTLRAAVASQLKKR